MIREHRESQFLENFKAQGYTEADVVYLWCPVVDNIIKMLACVVAMIPNTGGCG